MTSTTATPERPDYARLFRLDGRRAVVVGAGSGIGRESALALAAHGAEVVCVDRDLAAAEATAALGAGSAAYELDVTDAAAVDRAAAELGEVDVLVFTAATTCVSACSTTPQRSSTGWWASTCERPSTSCGPSAPGWPSAGGEAHRLQLHPGRDRRAGSGRVCRHEGGMVQLLRAAAVELGQQGVRVDAIAPGIVDTPLTAQIRADEEWSEAYASKSALGRWSRPDELAGAVVYLASDAASFVTGSQLFVDGGWTVIDGRYTPPT